MLLNRNKMRQSGFNLIENMVTLFILSVGLLGIAGMQATAIKIHQNSYQYNRALTLAQGLADRMRANPEGVEDGNYNYLSSSRAVRVDDPDCVNPNGCSPEEMAGHDVWEWEESLERDLPAGFGYVCVDSTPSFSPSTYEGNAAGTIEASCDNQGDNYSIHVVWNMDPDRDGDLTIDTDASESDGHFILVFQP